MFLAIPLSSLMPPCARRIMGTGLLALPYSIHTLGVTVGIAFLVLNLLVNYYAGSILHETATAVEQQQQLENRQFSKERLQFEDLMTQTDMMALNQNTINSTNTLFSVDTAIYTQHTQIHHDTATFDFIGIATGVFKDKRVTKGVQLVYYSNIFLVLGNYVLVMAHAVSAAIGEDKICLPTAGLIAAIGMLVVSQSRTMAKLGRVASIVSLGVLVIVVLQCLWEIWIQDPMVVVTPVVEPSLLRQLLRTFSATGSIGFAVGSQKLFLNVRHELIHRSEAPQALALSLAFFGSGYIAICLAAGPNPPPFLLDAIPTYTVNRRLAGLLLWIHVVVSYSINSQAICSSMDRLLWRKLSQILPCPSGLVDAEPATRWFTLTFLMAVLAYTVSNAIPFFKDLVALIGAVTAVPLTLLFPALFWRRHLNVPLFYYKQGYLASSLLTYFAMAFLILATIGCIYSIQQDWSSHGAPFSCH